jgi:Mg-chelatase subunit ChlD
VIYNYNKFTELSKAPLLKGVTQPQLFEIVPPEKPQPKKVTEPVAVAVVQEYVPEKDDKPVVPFTSSKKEGKSKSVKNEPTTGGVVHDTVRITDIIRIETVRQDTVYVSKVDTVYVGVPGENMMSMEGYATNNMVLLLDVSGSMNNSEKLPLLKKSVLLLLKMMREEDEVSIITYSGKAKVELPPTSFKEEAKITKVIERLKSEGSTDGNAGIKLAYEVADRNYIRGGNNRIILATDGEFPISNETFNLVKKFTGEDIFITVFNFGKTTLSAKNLKQLASLGNGNYEYVNRENVDMKLITEAKAKKKR